VGLNKLEREGRAYFTVNVHTVTVPLDESAIVFLNFNLMFLKIGPLLRLQLTYKRVSSF